MDLNTNFILLISAYQRDKPEAHIFNKFSDLCLFVKDLNLSRRDYRVFLSNLDEISELEYRLIPDKSSVRINFL